jgi:cobalamin biosynthesis protein CobD/CbiB
VEAPLLGAEFEQPKLRHAKRALRLVTAVSLLTATAAVLVQSWRRR